MAYWEMECDFFFFFLNNTGKVESLHYMWRVNENKWALPGWEQQRQTNLKQEICSSMRQLKWNTGRVKGPLEKHSPNLNEECSTKSQTGLCKNSWRFRPVFPLGFRHTSWVEEIHLEVDKDFKIDHFILKSNLNGSMNNHLLSYVKLSRSNNVRETIQDEFYNIFWPTYCPYFSKQKQYALHIRYVC